MTDLVPNARSFDDWKKDFVSEAIKQRHSMWTIGDLLNEGLALFPDGDGSRVWTVAEVTGHEYQTLAHYKSVAKGFPVGRRRLNIAFGIHEVIRGLDEPIQDALLDGVEAFDWKRKDIRERARAYKKGDLAAINQDWKPAKEPIEIDEASFTAGGKGDDDKPVFDSSDTGAALAAERDEKRDDFEAKSDANQILDNALSNVERACANSNRACLNRDRIDYSRVRAAIVALQDLLPREVRKPVEKPVTLKAPEPVNPPPAPVTTEEALEIPGFLKRGPDNSLSKEKADA